MSNSITTGFDISKLLLKSIYDPTSSGKLAARTLDDMMKKSLYDPTSSGKLAARTLDDMMKKSLYDPTTTGKLAVRAVDDMLKKSVYDPSNSNVLRAVIPRKFGWQYVASNTIRGCNDPPADSISSSWFKRQVLNLNFHAPGTIRISFDLFRVGSGGGISGQIRRNGVVLGVERTTNSTTPTTFTEDFNMSQFAAGDDIELWTKSHTMGTLARVENLRIMHDIIITERGIYTPLAVIG